MTDTLSAGWTRSQADARIKTHRRVFGLALALQIIIGALFLFCPVFALGVVGLPAAAENPWPSIWGATLIFVTVMQIPGVLNPVHQRYPVLIAVLGRALMVATFVAHGGHYLWFAAFDAVFGILIYLCFRRLVIAELMSRP
ncbi:MAG: hypothetical protein ABJI96_07670 [Paracoccaceae bacterium]